MLRISALKTSHLVPAVKTLPFFAAGDKDVLCVPQRMFVKILLSRSLRFFHNVCVPSHFVTIDINTVPNTTAIARASFTFHRSLRTNKTLSWTTRVSTNLASQQSNPSSNSSPRQAVNKLSHDNTHWMSWIDPFDLQTQTSSKTLCTWSVDLYIYSMNASLKSQKIYSNSSLHNIGSALGTKQEKQGIYIGVASHVGPNMAANEKKNTK